MEAKNDEFSNILKVYPYQVAGHFDLDPLRLSVDGCVLKPVQRPPKGEREVVFYEAVFNKDEKRQEILELRRFLPHYHGIVELDSSRYLKLENITSKFVLPCIMDIKIGKVTWDDDASEAFKERRKNKWPLREILGFSILGYMVYNHKTSSYERCRRDWCLKLNSVEGAEKTFQDFFRIIHEELKHSILEELTAQLTEIQKWFRTQRLYNFIASSILVAYDGVNQRIKNQGTKTSPPYSMLEGQPVTNNAQHSNVVQLAHLNNFQQESQPQKMLVDARIIDTAHVFLSSEVDSNYLFGLENVISVVERIKTNSQRL